MRLVEVRLLDGPNLYRLEPAVKVEVALGRRRTWYGERLPGPHALVRLGEPVPWSQAPLAVRRLAAWVERLHVPGDLGAWHAGGPVPATVHGSSEPGHWVVAFPWRERERAEALAQLALRLTSRGHDPADPPDGGTGGRAAADPRLARALRAVSDAGRTPPGWIRDADRAVPIVSISGTNGKTTTSRMITRILRAAGRHVGTTTSDGVLIDETMVEEGDLTGPLGARRVLGDPAVEVAVLETARGGLLLRGLGYESNDVSVLTNVSSDHLDLQGLHTLPELVEVKSIIARVTRPNGTVVLNAEDGLVAGLAGRLRAPVCWFALAPRIEPARSLVAHHLRAGGRAMVIEEGWVAEHEGGRRTPVMAVGEIPSTLLGRARHNVANALAAAAAARALGVAVEHVAAGLRSYEPTADMAPGRLNLYRLGQRVIIVDFAHNEAGLAATLDVAEGLMGTRAQRAGRGWLSVIVGTAGDRPDDTLRGLGRTCAARADEVAIKETLHYLRGRTRESVVGEIMAGIREAGGMATADVPVYEDEAAALRAELTTDGRLAAGPLPGVLLVTCHQDRAGVAATLAGLGATPADRSDLEAFLALTHRA